MEYNATERSNCGVNFTTEDLDQLESVEEMYFKMREIKEEDDEDDYSDSSSDDEGDDTDQDEAVEIMEIYETERSKVQAFYSETCKCKMGVGEMACSATLSLDDITECRNNCSELSSAELDLVILGIIHSSLNCSETSISGRVEKTRQSTRMCFFYHGKRICKKTFLFLHCLQYFRFHSLVKHYKKNGLTLTSVWPQENENITKCHVRKRKCASKHILKKPILRSDRDLAHTKEQYITRTTTHSSCTIPQILTSQDQSILKRQENVHSLVYAVKQFLAKSIFLLTKTF